ncbi:unnamed protein product [Cylicocyclus nassatus]|uniref:Uncharacterized protein n=1 Tax=Cylicocyclus nassatus TaxID=53992 RepID=A0AA36H8Y0_CYLNA|nr:unnamed protein product [Cylicocyclus nassatus]
MSFKKSTPSQKATSTKDLSCFNFFSKYAMVIGQQIAALDIRSREPSTHEENTFLLSFRSR